MLFILIAFIVVACLVVEWILHTRRLQKIPLRIHVNGTRGKSSVVRMISEALRAAGIQTLAKTTGNQTVLIYPDGHEEIIRRRGPSRIQEQIGFVRKAAALHSEAIVVECMAIEPSLQFVSETKMIRAAIGVITNVRQDHLEVMGDTLDDIAESLSLTIPKNGKLVTGDQRYYEFFKVRADEKNTEVLLVDRPDPKIHVDFPNVLDENLLITEKVCSLLREMGYTIPHSVTDRLSVPNVPQVHQLRMGGRTVHFIDAFSANDIDSTMTIQNLLLKEPPCPRPFIALLNNRADRPLRMRSFASFLGSDPLYDYIMLIGDNRWLAQRYIARKRRKNSAVMLNRRDPERLLEEIFQRISLSEFTIVGMGNYKGSGELFCRMFKDGGEKKC